MAYLLHVQPPSADLLHGKGNTLATHPEALLISAVLQTGDHLTALNAGVNRDKFHVYAKEWRWIEHFLSRFRKPPSKVAFTAKFKDFPLKKVDDVEHFAEEVNVEHGRFLLTNAMNDAIELVESGDLDGAVASMHKNVIQVQSSLEGAGTSFDIQKDWTTIYDDVRHRVTSAAETGVAGMPTGFKTVDMESGGPMAGDLWVVAARLGQGKTWTLINMATQMLMAGAHVGYFALEQNRRQIGMRFIPFLDAALTGKSSTHRANDLYKGTQGVDLVGLKAFLASLNDVLPGKLTIHDQARGKVNPLTIAAAVERDEYDVVIVDYIQILAPTKDWQAVAEVSGAMKVMPQTYEIPFVIASQIGRDGDGFEPPKAKDLAGSDAIGQDADGVITMAQQSPSVVKLRNAKLRNGRDGGMFYAHFDVNHGIYKEISGDRATDLIHRDKEER